VGVRLWEGGVVLAMFLERARAEAAAAAATAAAASVWSAARSPSRVL